MRRDRALALALPLVLVVVLAQCTAPAPPITDLPECPHSWKNAFGIKSEKSNPGIPMITWVTNGNPNSFLISREITDIPEFHDCQRPVVVRGPSRSYGELGAIFARFQLDSALATFAVRTATQTGAGVTGAVRRIALAEIASEGDDEGLGIRVGFNCLIAESSGSIIEARMYAMGRDHTTFNCVQMESSVPTSALPFTPLSVHVQRFREVPPAARWEWDVNAQRPLVGTKCGSVAWCTFGPRGQEIALPDAVGSAALSGESQSPGWYDEQYLADLAAATPGGLETGLPLTPSTAFSTVIPSPHLSTFLGDAGDWTGRWIEAAHVAMPKPMPLYASKLGLRHTTVPVSLGNLGGLNRLEVCIGTMRQCEVTYAMISDSAASGCSATVLALLKDPGSASSFKGHWSRIIPPGQSSADRVVRYHCTTYRSHPGVTIPLMARWRWKADDETIWVYCPEGCCEVHSSPF